MIKLSYKISYVNLVEIIGVFILYGRFVLPVDKW